MVPRPPRSHPRTSLPRTARTLLAALVIAAVAVPLSGAARPTDVPAPAPAALAPLRAATPAALAQRYAVNRGSILAAERTATRHGDRKRAAALRELAEPARHFFSFDGRNGGRSVEVFGDLSRARRIAVLVPGAGISLDRYWRLRSGAVALSRELGEGAAVIGWLGYRTPDTVSRASVTTGRAKSAATELRTFLHGLKRAEPSARTSLLCHSYGSVVCAEAAPGLAVSDIVLYGSPGTGARNAAALHSPATVWAGRGRDDWIAEVPHVRLRLPFVTLGFGTDPVARAFGARHFAAGDGGHSDYLKPGSLSLRNIARIVSGRTPAEEGRHA
ncbi:alpha/beta hydrolase [Streptomyces sp. NBC_00316]|uniref:alpha/beta hydrolase n=1 Tax=Streptomyces sp. NBC_00316 TaxID=2975710 RepID=UPI002E2D5055|nr:alpha/beta hydrolase [Streptomyces sp. NBC_00316]